MSLDPALVVSPRSPSADALVGLLAGHGVEVVEAAGVSAALEVLRARPVSVLVAPADSGGPEPYEFFRRAVRLRPTVVGVAVGGSPPAGAWPSGVFDWIPEDTPQDLGWRVERALAQRRLLDAWTKVRQDLQGKRGFHPLVGRSESMERLRERLDRLARSEAGVLLVGEPGSGKEHAARTLHAWSTRAERPFVAVACEAADPARIELDLFGHERGAVPGRDRRGIGLLEAAEGGTVFLDELAAIPPAAQDRLLAALRSGAFRRTGGTEDIPLLARVVAATSRDPERAVDENLVREDLLRRLAAETVSVPPLRARQGDLPLLVREFVDAIRAVNDLPDIRVLPETFEALERHVWPGNVRELRNAVEQAVILAADGTIRVRDLPEAVRRAGASAVASAVVDASRSFREAKRDVVGAFERSYLMDLMARHGGNVTAGAGHAGMLRSALQRLLRKHDIRSSEFRPSRGGRPADDAP